ESGYDLGSAAAVENQKRHALEGRLQRSPGGERVVGFVVWHEDHFIAIAARVSDTQRVEGDRRSWAFLDLLLNRLHSDCRASASQCAAAGFGLKLKGCQTHDVAIANEESYDRRYFFEIAIEDGRVEHHRERETAGALDVILAYLVEC